jgi:4-carboxymuconolactone decarboxylase
MAHVTLVDPTTATDETQAALAQVERDWGRLPNVFRAMAHSPRAAQHVSATGGALRAHSVLPEMLREMVILAVAGRWACAYEQNVHLPIARRLGLPEATIQALTAGEVPPGLAPTEAAAVEYARALSREGRADPALVERLRAAFGERGLVELTLLAGWYSLLAMFLNGLAIDLDRR